MMVDVVPFPRLFAAGSSYRHSTDTLIAVETGRNLKTLVFGLEHDQPLRPMTKMGK